MTPLCSKISKGSHSSQSKTQGLPMAYNVLYILVHCYRSAQVCYWLQLQQSVSCFFSSYSLGLSFFRCFILSLPRMCFFWIFTWPSPYHFVSGFTQMSPSQLEPSLTPYQKCSTSYTLAPIPCLHFILKTLHHLTKCTSYLSCLYCLSLYNGTWAPRGSHIFLFWSQLSPAFKKYLAHDRSSRFVK